MRLKVSDAARIIDLKWASSSEDWLSFASHRTLPCQKKKKKDHGTSDIDQAHRSSRQRYDLIDSHHGGQN